MDQIPLPFVLDSTRSLNEIGQPVHIRQPGGDLDKRQSTILLCIRATGIQGVRPAIIFRNLGDRVPAAEQLASTF